MYPLFRSLLKTAANESWTQTTTTPSFRPESASRLSRGPQGRLGVCSHSLLFLFCPPRWFHTCRYHQDIHTYVCIHPPRRSFSALGWCNTPSFTIATLDVFLFMAGSVPKDLGIRVRNLSRKVWISRRNENKAKWIFNVDVSPKLWYFKVVRKVLSSHFLIHL